MVRNLVLAGVLGLATASAPVYAAETPASPAPAPAFSVAETDIGTLIDNPATKAVLDKYMPGFSTNEKVEMARSMTLKQVQQYAPDQFKDETLAKIDADLAKITPAAK